MRCLLLLVVVAALRVMVNGTKNPGGNRFWNATEACCDFFHQAPDDGAHLTERGDSFAEPMYGWLAEHPKP